MRALSFNNFVRSYGVNKLGEKLGVSDWAVRKWLRGDGAPRTDRIITIVKMMKNEMSIQDVFKECTRNKI